MNKTPYESLVKEHRGFLFEIFYHK